MANLPQSRDPKSLKHAQKLDPLTNYPQTASSYKTAWGTDFSQVGSLPFIHGGRNKDMPSNQSLNYPISTQLARKKKAQVQRYSCKYNYVYKYKFMNMLHIRIYIYMYLNFYMLIIIYIYLQYLFIFVYLYIHKLIYTYISRLKKNT